MFNVHILLLSICGTLKRTELTVVVFIHLYSTTTKLEISTRYQSTNISDNV